MPIYPSANSIAANTVYSKSNLSTASIYNNTHRINEIGFLEHESDYNKYQLSNSNIYLNVTRLSGGNIGG